MGKVSIVGFDYGQFDESKAGELQSIADQGRQLIRKTQIQFVAEFGELLCKAREHFKEQNESIFVEWMQNEFDISHSTAYRYMNAWERCLSGGIDAYENVSTRAMYLLGAASTPEAVRKSAKRIAAKKAVSESEVEHLIEKHNQKMLAKNGPVSHSVKDDAEEPISHSVKDETPDDDVIDEGIEEEPLAPDWTVQKKKVIKTIEALMRALDDLDDLRPGGMHFEMIEDCKRMKEGVDAWD